MSNNIPTIQENTLLFKQFVNFFGGDTENQKYDALMLYIDGLCNIEKAVPAYTWNNMNAINHAAIVQQHPTVFIKHLAVGAPPAVALGVPRVANVVNDKFNTSVEVNITSTLSTLNYEDFHPEYKLSHELSHITVNQGSQTDGYEKRLKHNDTHYTYYKRPNAVADDVEINVTQLSNIIDNKGQLQYPEFDDDLKKIYNVPFDLACFIHHIYTSLVTNDDGSTDAHPIPGVGGIPIYMNNTKYNNVLSVINALGSKRMVGATPQSNEEIKYCAFINIVKEHVRIFNGAGADITGQNESWADAKFFYYKHVDDLRYKVQIVARDKPSGPVAPLQLRDVSPFTQANHAASFDPARTAAQVLLQDTALLALSQTQRAAANAFVERGILNNAGVYVKIPNVNARNIAMVLAADRETRVTTDVGGAIAAADQDEPRGFGGPNGQVRALGAAKVGVGGIDFAIRAYGDAAAALVDNLPLVSATYNGGGGRVCGNAANVGHNSHVFRALYATGNSEITGVDVTNLIAANANGERDFSQLTVGQLRNFANNVRKILAPVGKVSELQSRPVGANLFTEVVAERVDNALEGNGGVVDPAINLTNVNDLLQGWGTVNAVAVDGATNVGVYFGLLNTLINAGLHATVGVVNQQKNYSDLIKSVDHLININTDDSKLNIIKKRHDARGNNGRAKLVVSIGHTEVPRSGVRVANQPIAVKQARDLSQDPTLVPYAVNDPVADKRTFASVNNVYVKLPRRHNEITHGGAILPTYNLYSDGEIPQIPANEAGPPMNASAPDGPKNSVLKAYQFFIKNKFSVRKYSRFARLKSLYDIEEKKIRLYNLDDDFFAEPEQAPEAVDEPYTYYRKKEDLSKLYTKINNVEVEVQKGSAAAIASQREGCIPTTGIGPNDTECTNFLLSCISNGDMFKNPSTQCQDYFADSNFWNNTKKEVLEKLLPFDAVYVLEKLGFDKVSNISPEGKTIQEFEPIANWYEKINKSFDPNTYVKIKANDNLKKYIDLVHGKVNSNPAILNERILQKSSKSSKSTNTNTNTSVKSDLSKNVIKTHQDIPKFNSSYLRTRPYSNIILTGGGNNVDQSLDNFINWYKNQKQINGQRGGNPNEHIGNNFQDFTKNNDNISKTIKRIYENFVASKSYDIKLLEHGYKNIKDTLSRKNLNISQKDQNSIEKLFSNIRKEYIKIAKALAMLTALEAESVLVDQDDGTINELEIQSDLIAKITNLNKKLSQHTNTFTNVFESLNKNVQ